MNAGHRMTGKGKRSFDFAQDDRIAWKSYPPDTAQSLFNNAAEHFEPF